MAISNNNNKIEYTANGVQTAFTFPYTYYLQTQLQVYVSGVLKTLGVDYTVSPTESNPGDGNPIGGTVTFGAAPANGAIVLIVRILPLTQVVVLSDGANFPAKTIEKTLDQLVMMLQQHDEDLARTFKVGVTEDGLALPDAATRANKYLGFDGSGVPVALSAPTDTALTTTYSETLLAAADAAAARTILGVPATAVTDALDTRLDTLESVGKGSGNGIINGCMDVWQRGTSFVSPVTNTYTADRWVWGKLGTGAVTVTQSGSVPSVAQAGVKLNYAMRIEVTTADAAIAADDWYGMTYIMEGLDWRHFAQREIVLSFWIAAPVTGKYCVSLRNTGSDRSYVAEYDINVADTYEKKTIVIPASPSAGTWDYLTGKGVKIGFAFAVGSNYHVAAGAWQNGDFLSTANQVNGMANAPAKYFLLTGVQLEAGNLTTPLAFRRFEEELNLCKRYFQKSWAYQYAPAQNTGGGKGEITYNSPVGGGANYFVGIRFEREMRVAPVVGLYNPNNTNSLARDINGAVDTATAAASNLTAKDFLLNGQNNAATAVGARMAINYTADAEFY